MENTYYKHSVTRDVYCTLSAIRSVVVTCYASVHIGFPKELIIFPLLTKGGTCHRWRDVDSCSDMCIIQADDAGQLTPASDSTNFCSTNLSLRHRNWDLPMLTPSTVALGTNSQQTAKRLYAKRSHKGLGNAFDGCQ